VARKKDELLDYKKRGVLGYKGWDYVTVSAGRDASGDKTAGSAEDAKAAAGKRPSVGVKKGGDKNGKEEQIQTVVGVELNLLRNKGVRIYVENESVIMLEVREVGLFEPVTHCYVDCMWFLSAPVVKSLIFYYNDKLVHTLKAT